MSKFWVVFKREYAQVVRKRSFLIGILIMPLLMGGFMLIPAYLASKDSSSAERLAIIDQSGQGIGRSFEESLNKYTFEESDEAYYNVLQVFDLQADDDEKFERINDSLRQLLVDDHLKYFLVIKPDAHLVDSNCYLVTNTDSFKSFRRFERSLSAILSTLRLEMSEVNLSVDSILSITRRTDLNIRDATGEAIPFEVKYFAALILVGIMFGMIIGYGQLVMRSIIEEKNSRIMEVLVSSVSPFQLMLGKILGLGAATFTQIAAWVIMGAALYTQKAALDVSPSVDRILFNPTIIVFFILFWVFGYVLMSTLFALIGSIVTNEKEAQSFVAPITMIMVLPFMIGFYVIQNPHSTVVTALSMIPFLTPTLMIMRIVFIVPTLTEVSLFSGIVGEALIGLVIVIVTMFGMIWLCSKIFRVGILMYGKRPTLPEIVKWVRY